MGDNALSGSLPREALSNGTRLRMLSLPKNQLAGPFPDLPLSELAGECGG